MCSNYSFFVYAHKRGVELCCEATRAWRYFCLSKTFFVRQTPFDIVFLSGVL